MLRTAIELADEGGIDSLTMRKLAHALGVEAMSLYYHVTNKDDLLKGILDIIVSEVEAPSSGKDWKSAVRKSAVSFHDVLMHHRWACSLLMSPSGIGPARMRYMESLLARLRAAGFSANMTHHAYHALDSHIIGSTLWQAGYSALKLPAEAEKAFIKDLPNQFPYLAEHMDQHITRPKRKDVPEFEFGLDLILDGLEKLRAGTRARG